MHEHNTRVKPEIDRQLLFEKLGYEYNSELQRTMHESDARFRIANCGRRFGKSTWAGHEMTYRMFIPDSIHWIVGPNYKLGEKEFRVVVNDFEKLGLLKRCRKSYNVLQGAMRLHFLDLNSVVEVMTAEKQDGLVGEGLDSVIMSETAKHKMSTWQMYIEPALSDKRGCADFPSTPQGYNWFKAMFDMGQDKEEFPAYDSFYAPTWENRTMYPGGFDDPELKRIRGTVSKNYWDQEYAAQFTSFEGMIYDEFSRDVHVRKLKYIPSLKNYWAMDFGFTDPTICLDIQVDTHQRVYVWREYSVSGLSTFDHGHALQNRDNPEGYHVNFIAADPNGADEIATLGMMFSGIVSNKVSWGIGIEAIKRAMKVREDGLPGLFIDPSCVNLIRQLSQLRKKTIREGQNERDGQHDYDDHCADALRYFFNEFFVMGGNRSLSDVYGNPVGSEAAGFFTFKENFTLGGPIGY